MRCWFRKAQIKPRKLQSPHIDSNSSLFYEMTLPLNLLISLVFSEHEVNKTYFKEKAILDVETKEDLMCHEDLVDVSIEQQKDTSLSSKEKTPLEVEEEVDLMCRNELLAEEEQKDTSSENKWDDGKDGDYVFDEDQRDYLNILQASSSKYMIQMPSMNNYRTEVARELLEFCKENKLKRETLYSALDYFDRFLMVKQDVTQKKVRQAGWVCLCLAQKNESSEILPILFGDVEKNDTTQKELELFIMKSLKYNLDPPHSIKWADVKMAEWDSFAMNSDREEFKTHLFSNPKSEMSKMVFKILDLLIVEAESVQFEPKVMAIGAIFVALGMSVGQWSFEEILMIINEKQWEKLTKCKLAEFFMKWVDFKEIVTFFEFLGRAALKLYEGH